MRDVDRDDEGIVVVSWPGIFNQLMLMPLGVESLRVRIVPLVPLDEASEQHWAYLGMHHALAEILRNMGLTYDPNRLWRG